MTTPLTQVAIGRATTTPASEYVPAPEPAPLPASVGAPQFEPAPVSAPQPQFVPRPRRCLIVDDSRVVRKISRRIVEGLGYQVLDAEDGQEALARCRHEMPDLILLDWDMPVMTGIEFVTQLRALGGPHRPKVVFCTSHGETIDIYKGIEAGADEYVTKPFTDESLKAKLGRIGAI
jgi:two-component system, chemotaxis family, chemotaxis protein CheY